MPQITNEYAKMAPGVVISIHDELWQYALQTMKHTQLPIIRNPYMTGVTLGATILMGKALGDPLDKIILSNTIAMVAGTIVAGSAVAIFSAPIAVATTLGIIGSVGAGYFTDKIYDNWPDIKTWTATQIDNFTNQVVTMTQDIAQAMAETLQEMGDFT